MLFLFFQKTKIFFYFCEWEVNTMNKQISESSIHKNIFAISNERDLKLCFAGYKPASESVQIRKGEHEKRFSLNNIRNIKAIPSLTEICITCFIQTYGPDPVPIVLNTPKFNNIHYNILDVNLPLKECHHITEAIFWKRVVLCHHRDKLLALKSDVNWKNLGISLKFVQLLEACSVEYWPEDILELIKEINEFITELHIRHLQSLKDKSFERYFRSNSIEAATSEDEYEGSVKEKLLAEKPKRKPQKNIKSFFEIEVTSSEDDGEDQIIDRRNKNLLIEHRKKYTYPAEHCHHIDLSFLEHFTNLDTLQLEFLGPTLNWSDFQQRHRNFSHDDICNLAKGISNLTKLRILHLRNSRMDAQKLEVLIDSLRQLEMLETIDFGFDSLSDDCGRCFMRLFESTRSIKNLELESNKLAADALYCLGLALVNYKNGHLEYLGLARNDINDNALHALVVQLFTTSQVENLSLKGNRLLTENGLVCCLANELLREHATLRKMDISAIRLTSFAADEIIRALDVNHKLLEFNCKGSGLDEQSEIDINVLIKRNKYILENPFLEQDDVPDDYIRDWLDRTRNPIMLAAQEKRIERAENWNRNEKFAKI